MFTANRKNQSNSVFIKLLRWPLKYARCQARCLVVGAVILFALIFLNSTNLSSKSNSETLSEENRATVEEKLDISFEEGILGGPVDSGNAAIIPVAQAAYDFTSDDEQENADYAISERSGLISQDNPAPGSSNIFGNIRKDVVTYTVQSGDTPSDIGIKFDINTDTILWANSLRDGDLIRPGDKLLILPINGVRIKVAAKDTLASLAKKYSGKTDEIIAFNELPLEGTLTAGDYIIIPNGELPSTAPKPAVTAPKYAKSTVPASNWLIFPTTGKDWGKIHASNGVDVANVCGTPIYAAAAGKVIVSDGIGWNGGYGKNVRIQHPNGVVTLYAHASQLVVGAGEEVAQGQLIALMGTTGRSTGCHLHFEVRGASNPLAGKQRNI